MNRGLSPFLSFLHKFLAICLLLLASTNVLAVRTVSTLTVGGQSASVTYGTGGSVTFLVSLTSSGSGTVSCTPSVSGLPAGVTSGGFSPTPVNFGNGTNANKTTTLTLNTTAATTQAVTNASFTVTCTVSNTGLLTVGKRALTITASNASKTYGQTPTLTAFTSSGLQNGEMIGSVILTSPGTAANASVSGSPYTITPSAATGGTFTASNYNITYATTGTLTVTPADQNISFTSTAPSATVGGPTYTPTATATSGLTVVFTIAAGSASVCSISSGSVSFIGVGTCTINANQSGNANYTAAPQVPQSFTVGPAAVSSFNAVEPSANAVNGKIFTKIAGQNFGLDIVALDASNAIATSFTGVVAIEVVDNTSGGGVCASMTTIATFSNQTFAGGDSGRHPLSSGNAVSNVWPNAKVRIKYPAGSPTVTVCSTDNFAIRPSYLSFLVRDATRSTAGTMNTLNNKAVPGGTVHNAGQPFQIDATAYNAAVTPAVTSNYAGTPAPVLSVCSGGTACTGTVPVLQSAFSIGSWSGSSGNIVTTTASYGEVGAFSLKLQDQTFAAVDSGDGTPQDCSASGSYVCSAVIDIGRFVPDHFTLGVGPVLTNRSDIPACSGSTFTYMGEPFSLSYTLRAENASNALTTLYTGATLPQLTGTDTAKWMQYGSNDSLGLWAIATNITVGADPLCKAMFSASTFATSYFCPVATAPAPSSASAARIAISSTPAAPTGAWSGGVGTFTANAVFNRANAPDGHFATLKIGIAPQDADGVKPVSFNLDTDNDSTNDRLSLGTASMRFGRLRLSNAFGSAKANLLIPVQVQYWSGQSWVPNQDDSCTSLLSGNFQMVGALAGTSASGVTIATGAGNLTLAKPTSPTATGSVGVCVDLGADPGNLCSATSAAMPWLQGKWPPGTNYDNDPSARATFGIYSPETKKTVHIRESF